MTKKVSAIILVIILAVLFTAGCGNSNGGMAKVETRLPKLNMSKWNYNKANHLYYQIGIEYCEKPADKRYEKLAVFVPEKYMNAKKNSGGTYTCKLNEKAKIKGYTATNAPIVMPVNTPGYISNTALTKDIINNHRSIFDEVSAYTSNGFVYVETGCRGADEGAPAGVVDLKAAVRYIRYSDDVVAGDADSIFMFGVSGGGAQAAVMGASGDSEMYEPYLKKIGAVRGVSDSVAGSIDWCPITSLNTANAEHEWMMGSTRTGQTKEEKMISDNLAAAYAEYVNKAGFTDKNGNTLTLTKSKTGIYQAGSYYEYIKGVIEESLNNFLTDTEFTDQTPRDYINELNADKKWINYDESKNTVKITSTADFCNALKKATRYPLAFDNVNEVDNPIFAVNGKGGHFDRLLADTLAKLKIKNASAFAADLKRKDDTGYTVEERVNMYTPLYFLMKSEKGFKTSTVAKYWRIRAGIEQPHTAITTEVNLALALENYDGVESVDFEEVWAQSHTQAEREGNYVYNFINWVNKCMKK